MDLTAAALLTTILSFVVYLTATAWYVLPWLRAKPATEALVPLLWVHAFRHIALSLFSAQRFGFAIPDGARDAIAYGDLAGMLLALAGLYALRRRWRYTAPLLWVFVIATVVDLGNAAITGIINQLFSTVFGVGWLILTFYVPALWISVLLVAWLLLKTPSRELTRGD